MEKDDYEKHVRVLAERLREANKAAGQQSKISHENAKRYYDRQTRLEQFCKGDLVYIHDPTHKRGKAKKFSYQYKGPFEIEQKISSLIYKVRLADGTSTIIHVNRLKRVYGQMDAKNELPFRKRKCKTMKLRQPKQSNYKGNPKLPETTGPDTEIPSYSQLIEDRPDSTSETEEEGLDSLPREQGDDSDWNPGSLYLQRKLQNDKTTADVAYHLRSRLVSRSRQGKEGDKAGVETNDPSGSEYAPTNTSPDKARPATCHPYNLRSRIESASGVTQTK